MSIFDIRLRNPMYAQVARNLIYSEIRIFKFIEVNMLVFCVVACHPFYIFKSSFTIYIFESEFDFVWSTGEQRPLRALWETAKEHKHSQTTC